MRVFEGMLVLSGRSLELFFEQTAISRIIIVTENLQCVLLTWQALHYAF